MNSIDQECTPFGATRVTLEGQCFDNGPGLGDFERTGVNRRQRRQESQAEG